LLRWKSWDPNQAGGPAENQRRRGRQSVGLRPLGRGNRSHLQRHPRHRRGRYRTARSPTSPLSVPASGGCLRFLLARRFCRQSAAKISECEFQVSTHLRRVKGKVVMVKSGKVWPHENRHSRHGSPQGTRHSARTSGPFLENSCGTRRTLPTCVLSQLRRIIPQAVGCGCSRMASKFRLGFGR